MAIKDIELTIFDNVQELIVKAHSQCNMKVGAQSVQHEGREYCMICSVSNCYIVYSTS